MGDHDTRHQITYEDAARLPAPGMATPQELNFSPDDRLVTFLHNPEGGLHQQLYALDVESGAVQVVVEPPGSGAEAALSIAEQQRRERKRLVTMGITQYAWSDHDSRMIVPLHGDIYVQDGPGQPLRQVIDGSQNPASDAFLSPDGQWLAYVQDAEVYVVPAAGGQPRQVTSGVRSTGKTHGMAEFIAQEELHRREGLWWSPDSQRIAFTEVDETHIPIFRITHQGKRDVVHEDLHYPFAGDANAIVRLGVVGIDGGQPVWMDLGDDPDIYLARVNWFPDGSLTAQLMNRAQTALDLVRFDPATGQRTLLLQESSPIWINLHDMLKPLQDGGFIWASERSGFRHLYLHDHDGRLVRQLTDGEWIVNEVVGVDEQARQVYFVATRDHVTELQLYAVSFDGGPVRRITPEPGTHTIVISHHFRHFIDTHSALDQPSRVTLRALDDGAVLHTIYDGRSDPRVDEFDLPAPELVTLKNRDGVTLYGAIYRPPAHFGSGPFPTVVNVYGGPGPQMVTNSWPNTAQLQVQHLRENGFLVFKLDNRGSARRGLAFEGAIKHRLGGPEVDDQVDGVRWLIDQGLADPERIGIFGWSYGGMMSVMCLARAASLFKVAVAGAPSFVWEAYDTGYTERYMGTPQANPEAYAASSATRYVDSIQGRLLLIHGLIDENVHFRHTALLIEALIQAGKPYDLLLLPNSRHLPRDPAYRTTIMRATHEYFQQYL